MQGDTFKVGDVVVVREWDDMASEYTAGPEFGGRIHPGEGNRFCFIAGMRGLCGTERKITWVSEDGEVLGINDEDVGRGHWYIEPWMLRHIDDAYFQDDIEDVSDEEFASLLQAAGA